MTKSLYFMENISQLRVCGWNTLALAREELATVQATMRAAHPLEAVVLSCQRVEAYGFGPCDCNAPFAWHGREALDHLTEVAAGLHSAVLGEAQILGQVRDGFAESSGALRSIGDTAIAAAREMRRRTEFDSHAGHLLDRALKVASVPAAGRLLVIGTGQMGRLVAERAREIGFAEVVVAGRARPAGFDGEWLPLSRLRDAKGVDVVVGCLGSGATEMAVESLPGARLYVDLGTPRNFVRVADDGTVASAHGGARLLGLAELMKDESKRPHARRRRNRLRNELRAIVDARFGTAEESGRAAVGALRGRVEAIRQREVARMRRLHPEVPEAAIEAMTRSLVNQLMHRPTERLRGMEPRLSRELIALFD